MHSSVLADSCGRFVKAALLVLALMRPSVGVCVQLTVSGLRSAQMALEDE